MLHPLQFSSHTKVRQWKFDHICTQPEQLPDDFFFTSPFGKSLVDTTQELIVKVQSKLRIERFEQLGFPQRIWGILENRLPLLMHMIPEKKQLRNHTSLTENENLEFVHEALEKWEITGVFRYTEDRPFLVNALKVIIKEKKKRLVLDARSSGLNDCIIAPKFALPNIELIVNTLFDGSYMIKADLAAGFLQLPINKREQTFLGFEHPINKRFCVLQRLPFGLASAPFLFQTFTQSLEKALVEIAQIPTKVYIDDWLLTDVNSEVLQAKFQSFQNLLEFLGVSLQHSKTEGPCTRLIYLGLGVDTFIHEIFQPEIKRSKYLNDLNVLLKQKESTMDWIAKIAGKLVHISSIHRAGMAHVQPLWKLMYQDRKL